jgi:DNA-binding transcriptional LysR family regulator
MIPSHFDLSYFLEVASTLNISRAAERIGISQPSLSVSLKRLESVMGTPLLIRAKSGVQLTKAGRYLAQRGKNLLQEWEGIKAGALEHTSGLAGRFTLGCHVSVASYSLPVFLPKLLNAYPQIELQLAHDLSRKITEAVISHQLDFGIVVNPVSHPDLVIQLLCEDRVMAWDKAGRFSETLLFDPNLNQSQVILQKLEKKGVHFRRTITSSSLEVIASLAEAGAGTAILPSRVAMLCREPLQACGTASHSDRVCLVYRADAQKSNAAKAVIQAVKDAFRNP